MTIKELLGIFENYYGEKYQGIFLDATQKYLSKFSESFLIASVQIMFTRIPRTFNKSPGPYEFEQHKKEIFEAMDTSNEVKKISAPDKKLTDAEREKAIDFMDGLLLWLGEKSHKQSKREVSVKETSNEGN